MSQDNHPAFSPEREALRTRHGVRAISNEEEGYDVKQLPTGIYGFTSAPAAPQMPLFIQPIVRCTEVHKTTDGEIYLIGYVEPAEAETIESGSASVHASLYPEPRDKATALVALPMSRIDQRHPPSRENGNWMAVEIAPRN
jgi:hypothetical protein